MIKKFFDSTVGKVADIVLNVILVILLSISLVLPFVEISPDLQKTADSSVQLQTENLRGFCSGTFVDSKKSLRVLTARHCVESVGQVIKIPYKGTTYDFLVEKISTESDLALLSPKEDFVGLKDAVKIPLGDSAHYREKSWAIGYALGASQTITEGYLGALEVQEAFSDVSRSKTFQRASVLIAPGNSGGGLFQIEDGEYRLVGVATGINGKYFFVTYYSPLEEIKEFVNG